MKAPPPPPHPAGYLYILHEWQILSIPHWHESAVGRSIAEVHQLADGRRRDVYRSRSWPGDSIIEHLHFAIKYDGVHLALLSLIFERIDAQALADSIAATPTGQYARLLWFYYEFLTAELLALPDATSGKYVEALDAELYYTHANPTRSRRHRVVNNLLGTRAFCPLVRRSAPSTDGSHQSDAWQVDTLRHACDRLRDKYSAELFSKTASYLYTKETRSSFAIEHIEPDATREQKFVAALRLAEEEDFCTKEQLIRLQRLIVDPRFAVSDYRDHQNFVGERISLTEKRIHYICPRPEDIHALMEGLLCCHRQLLTAQIPAHIHAAIISYAFVFLHPFEDGNGRIHRFLIHHILSRRGSVPPGFIFPVSAVMKKRSRDYDASLEQFSQPLLACIPHRLDAMSGQLLIEGETAHWYRYIDYSAQAHALADFLRETVQVELVEQLEFLRKYPLLKRQVQDIVDMPDREIERIITLGLAQGGAISRTKRKRFFPTLHDEEIDAIERSIQEFLTEQEEDTEINIEIFPESH